MSLPDKVFGIDTKEAYDRFLARPPNEKPQEQPISPLESNLESWSIPGVNYRNGIYTVDLGKQLLDNSSSKTQDQWSEYSKQAISKGQFHLGDFPLYHALFTALFNSKSDPKTEEIRQFLNKNIAEKWFMTLTRILCEPRGSDRVIHNYGLKDQYGMQKDIVGPSEWVKDSTNPAPYKALLDTDNTQEINQVWSWLTGKNAYLFRVNAKPKQIDELVAGFYSYSGWVVLDCYGIPQFSGSIFLSKIIDEILALPIPKPCWD